MGEQYLFPMELLNQSINERVIYFQNLTINHKIMQDTMDALLENIFKPAGASIIMVFGPSGVGKTTLKRLVEMKIIEKLMPQLEEDRGMIPVAGIELVSPDLGNFNWKDYYKRALQALKEPLIEHKISFEKMINDEMKKVRISNMNPRTAPEFRESLEKAFNYRKPLAFIVDEAQHFAKMTSGKRIQDQLDSIKSIANITGITHVLIGTYDLINFANLSGQLSRRTVDINFSRYTLEKEDIAHFQRIIYSLQRKLPLADQTNLLEHWEFIYERTVGCVGILKNWLERCLYGVLSEGKECIGITDLEKYALSINKVDKIVSEVLLGESLLMEDEEKRKKIHYMLGLNIQTEKVQNRVTKKVGQRKPKRDLVGEIDGRDI
ncbi:ATP-binding protein [Bacillus mycoides]|nr:ATP-binding protein [Bacillus mycoides]